MDDKGNIGEIWNPKSTKSDLDIINGIEIQKYFGKKMILFIFATWCGHCQRAKDPWFKFLSLLEKYNKNLTEKEKVYAFRMDCDGPENKKYLDSIDFPGSIPDIRLIYSNGKKKKYEGERDPEAFLNAIKTLN